MAMIVLENGPQFSDYEFKSFALIRRLTKFLVIKAGDSGKCCEDSSEACQIITAI